MRKNEIFELEFKGAEPMESKINVNLKAVFTIGESVTEVKGFYAGKGVYKIRFLPDRTGKYNYKTEGLFETEGSIICEDSNSKGILRVEGTKFIYQDGSLFHPFGTTVYALVHQENELVNQTLRSLSESPFNKVRMCVFPKNYEWNRNEPPLFAFEFSGGNPDVNKPVYEFWDMLESRLSELNSLGIQSDLILFHPYDKKWGFDEMSMEDCLIYLEYLTRRLSAFPNIWWSLANEYDLIKAYIGRFEAFAEYIANNDPYKHLISNHQLFSPWDFNNLHTTHVCTQTKEVNQTPRLMRFNKPVVYDEVRYEGNIPLEWGNLSAEEMTNRFWRATAAGAYCTHGETFITQENSQDEILWWSKGGTLKGQSPKRIAYLKELIYSLPGKLEPVLTGFDLLPQTSYEDLMKMAAESNHPMSGFLSGMTKEGFDCLAQMPRYIHGHINEEVYLYYLADQCAAVFYIDLPEGAEYKVEVIDTWEMTRKIISEQAYGKKIKINLPGKPYMAILATKNLAV